MNKYWVKYRYRGKNWSTEDGWNVISDFITTGEDQEFSDLEAWWNEESKGDFPHELLEVVKL